MPMNLHRFTHRSTEFPRFEHGPAKYPSRISGDSGRPNTDPISEVTHEQLSGSISVTATVETPLIIGSVQRTKTQATKSNPSREIKTPQPSHCRRQSFHSSNNV